MKRFILALVLFLGLCVPAWADTYYCLIFAYDSKPVPLPCKCHVWGEFVQVDDNGKLVKHFPVSWEPDKISYIDRSRPGMHSTLKDNMEYVQAKKRSLRVWGPFETDQKFFDKAEAQYKAQGKYKFLDCCTRKDAQNCIHRLSDIAGPHRTGIYWGWWAADSVYKHYRRHGVIRDAKDDRVMALLGIEKYAMKRMR